ncbi:protein MMS22-like [Gracilinanus agilis]|uniref:protein MMS22-like n=1 Tax=Gracilinanus agilis TaxID=191870 RepID=UPI001CFC8DFA|nr:protein MMS22-like [Gracilinanus agilis]
MDDHPIASSFLTESLELELETEWCRPPCFSCASDGKKNFSPDSYLASGSLKRLMLSLDPLPTNFEEDIVELFGFQWVTEIALVNSSRDLFSLCRQQIYKLETLLQTSGDLGQASALHSEANNIRHHCVMFLHYVKVFIFRYLRIHETENDVPLHPYEVLEAQLPSVLVEELHGLILYTGRLSEHPSVTPGAFIVQNQIKLFPPSWHLIHLRLDIHWLVLEILHILGEKASKQVVYGHQLMNMAGENLTSVSLFKEHCENLLCDLISLSVSRYAKVRPSEAVTSHHCPCLCIKELWVLLIQLLDHRSKGCHTEPFWRWMNKLLKDLFKKPNDTERPSIPVVPSKDPLGFSWWIIIHLASFYQFDRNGVLDEKKQMNSNWDFVEELLKKSTNVQDGILEEQVRMYLHCCLTLCGFWNPNIQIVTILWDYYSKNLNSSFTIPWLGLQEFATISKSTLSMLEIVKTCCSDEQSHDLYKSNSSYDIFLCVLAKVMKKAIATNEIHPWNQIKGRIYSKFHQKRMEELTEVGLQNFFKLFLVLAAVAKLEDVVSRVLDLLDFLRPGSVTPSQRALVWKAQMAFLLMYVQRNLDVGVLAQTLSGAFSEKAKEFLVSKNELGQKHTLWMLLSIYMDGVQEVFEMSRDLKLSEEILLNDGFSMLLPACREAQLGTVLSFLQTVLARVRSVYQQSYKELPGENSGLSVAASSVAKEHHLAAIAQALWRNFFPFLKSQRMSQTVPIPQLADTAAGFTCLALDMPRTAPSDLQPQPVISMMQLFGWDDMIWPQLVSRYLSHLIENKTLSETLSRSGCTSFQALTVRSWIRCVLQMHMKDLSEPNGILVGIDAEQTVEKEYMEQLAELTRLLFQLPEVKNILSKAQVEHLAITQDPPKALVLFLEAVGITFSSLQTLSEKSAMVTKALEYLGEVLKYVKPYLGKKSSNAGLQLTYKIMGVLVKSWALILATSKAQKLLFRIIDCLLLPHAVLQQEKDLPTAMLTAIRKSLPLYLQGMCVICCHSQTQNAYLNQLLGNIVEQYIGRFLPASPSLQVLGQHPVLLALNKSAITLKTASLQKTVVQVIRKSYIQFKGTSPPPRLASILAFILELFKKTNMDIDDMKQLLPSILKCLLLVNEPQVKRLATENLDHIVKACQAGSGGEPATQLTSVFRQFVQDYSMIYEQQVYNILEKVAELDQQIVTSLISTLTQCLKDSELKQGLGRNIAQREAYGRLLSLLGQPGQEERLKLENENT